MVWFSLIPLGKCAFKILEESYENILKIKILQILEHPLYDIL